jgi:hypothetical protein
MTVFESNRATFLPVSSTTATLGRNDPEIGTRCVRGGVEYMFVHNAASDSAISVGLGVTTIAGASSPYSVTISTVTSLDMVVGVGHVAIATSAYGWVVVKGRCTVKAMATSGTIASNEPFYIAANGLFAPASNTTGTDCNYVGKALAEIVSSATGWSVVNCF